MAGEEAAGIAEVSLALAASTLAPIGDGAAASSPDSGRGEGVFVSGPAF